MKALAYTIFFILILLFFYILYLLFVSRLIFDFKLKDIDLSTLNLEDFLQTGQTKTKIQVEASILNKNYIGVGFSNIHIWFYNNGSLIAQTSEDVKSNFENMHLPANGTFYHTDTLDLFVSLFTAQLFNEIRKGNSQKIDYYIEGTIFDFIPFAHNDFFNT